MLKLVLRRRVAILSATLAGAVLVASLVVAPAGSAAAATEFGAEVVVNGGFDDGTTGWKGGDPTQVLVQRIAGDGNKYASVWAKKTGPLALNDAATTVSQSGPGVTYQMSAKVRTQYGNLDGQVRIQEAHGASAVTHTASFALRNAQWTTVTTTFTTTLAVATLDISVVTKTASAYQPLQVDDISLRTVTKAIPTTSAATTAPPATTTASCTPDAVNGTKFGAALHMQSGSTFTQAWNRATDLYGTMPIVRVFFPGPPANWSAATTAKGADLIVSFKILPKDVLSGKYDNQLRSWFSTAPKDVQIYWSYYHEPEDNIANGEFTSTDYRNAWRRIAGIADEGCHANLHATLILMEWTVNPKSGRTFTDYYPGSDVIDVLGWDPYNPPENNSKYVSSEVLFSELVRVSKSLGKPFGIAEIGSLLMGGDTGAGRAAWLLSTSAYLKSNGALFVTYFDTTVGHDYRLLDAPSQGAWRSLVSGS